MEQQRDLCQTQLILDLFTQTGNWEIEENIGKCRDLGEASSQKAEGWGRLKPQLASGPVNYACQPTEQIENLKQIKQECEMWQRELQPQYKQECCSRIVHGTVMLISEKHYN